MTKRSLFTLSPLLLVIGSLSFADTDQAATMHEQVCTGCHTRMTGGDGSVLYTRKNRMVTNLAELEERIDYCAKGANADWSAEQVQQVVNYLNKQYYRF